MPVTTDDKQQSKSTTLPVSQLTIKKTPSLTSSQCKRHLTDKLSSGNFSSVFKLKVPQHCQDRESDVLFKSCGQSNAREIGNFQQGHRKQRKIQESFGATKSGSYKRRIMNRQQPHATLESEREKLETEEDKLGNRHNDPDHNVDTVWYKGLWWAVKKQAKKIANSNADADSSSDESVSNKTRVTKRPSGSTRNKHGKKLVSDENFIFPSSEGLKIESWEKASYRKMVHVPPIDAFQPKQVINEMLPALAREEVDRLIPELQDAQFRISIILDVDSENEKVKNVHKKCLDQMDELQKRAFTHKSYQKNFKDINNNESYYAQGHWEENEDEEEEEVADNHQENGEHLKISQNLDILSTMYQIQDEGREVTKLRPEQILSMLLNNWGLEKPKESNGPFGDKDDADDVARIARPFEERYGLEKPKESNGPFGDKDDADDVARIARPFEERYRHKSTEASEGSMNRPIHPVDRHTTYNSQEDNRIGMRGSMINENWCKVQDKQIPSSEVNTDISSDESWSTVESTLIRLYRNVIRNETSRMMSSIDMVRIEAEHLFGLERSRIFFDLLDEELCHFRSTRVVSEFVPNMAEPTVRQHVISFFEHGSDMISRLMTLLRCPDRIRLQQMPVQNFISLMKSVIKSSLKTQTKEREKLSLEGNIYTMVDPKNFERALGEEIPEDVLNRLRSEDEMVVQRFVDTRQERHQPSDTRENSPIHYTFFSCIHFPSDCRLYIYIPTLNGSYWHESDMRRANRIRRHSR